MRPIDADALSEIVEDGLRNNPHKGGLERVCHRTEYTHFLDVICRMPTIAPPPNDPLTLEELREMGGEPVWARDLTQRFLSGWGIVYENVVEGKSRIYSFVGYGDKWIAYRRKPEGGDCVDR